MMTFVPLLLLLLFTRRFPRSFPADSRPIQNACVGSFAVLLFFFILLFFFLLFPFYHVAGRHLPPPVVFACVGRTKFF